MALSLGKQSQEIAITHDTSDETPRMMYDIPVKLSSCEWKEFQQNEEIALPSKPVKRPAGRVPNKVKAWLEVNEKFTGWKIAVCKCGKWYHSMDGLAPYYTEMNWCKKCGYQYQ